jgi:hypothetical protein
MENRVTGHHVRPQPECTVREQRKRYGGMYATPIYLREQAVEEELTARVVPNEDIFMRPAAKSPSNVVMWLACRDFALFRSRRGKIVCHQKRKDRRLERRLRWDNFRCFPLATTETWSMRELRSHFRTESE